MRSKEEQLEPEWVGLSTLGARSYSAPLSDRSPTSRTQLKVGSQLQEDRFVIERVLGSGGEGTVYAAYDTKRQQSVALKILHREFVDSSAQLKREFRFLANLIHPRLVHLHELFVTEEISFFTMALVEGPTLQEALKDRSLLRKLILGLCEGLSFLHENGRIHRDVKPTNALVSRNEELVLVDFGVGLLVNRRAEEESGPIGTPRYMAPEVLRGRDATAKSDAYSVGVLLFEALTGELPFANATDSLAHKAPAPSSLNPDVDLEYDILCERLLLEDPNLRASVEEAIELLSERASHRSFPYLSNTQTRSRPFVGRDRELGRLGAAQAQAQSGDETVVCLVSGKSGFGKTAFLEEFMRFSDGVVLYGQCSEQELIPHKGIDGVIEELAQRLATMKDETVLELIPSYDAHKVIAVFPELRAVPLLDRIVSSRGSESTLRNLRHEAYAALGRIFSRVAQHYGLTIIIDDLQWADLDAIRLLSEVFGSDDSPRCMVVLAFRSEEESSSAALRALLTGTSPLVDRIRTLRIQLEPLHDRAATQLLRRQLGQRETNDGNLSQILAECQGCPLLLSEVGIELSQSPETPLLNPSLTAILTRRLARLDSDMRRAFSLLAICGKMETRLLAQLSKVRAERLIVELESVRLARSRDGGNSLFVLHDRIREQELSRLGAEAEGLHLLLAEALVQNGAEPALIAHHFMAAGAVERASSWAERAADLASRSLALTAAIDLYRLALRGEAPETERAFALRDSLAFALADAGHGAEAAPIFAELAQNFEEDVALEYRTRAAAQFLSSGRIAEGWNELRMVNAAAGLPFPETPREAIVQVARARAQIWWSQKRGPKPRNDSPALRQKLNACRAGWSISYVSTAHGAANSSRYLQLALESGAPEHLGLAYGIEGLFRATGGSAEETTYFEYRALAEKFLEPFDDAYHRGFRGYLHGQGHYLLGNFAESLSGYEKAELEFTRNCRDVAWELSSARIFWGISLLLLGRHRELDRRLADWIKDAEDRGDQYALAALSFYSARRLFLRDADLPGAFKLLAEAESRWKTPYLSVHRAMGAFAKIVLLISYGDFLGALRTVEELRADLASSLMNRAQVVRLSYWQTHGLVVTHMLRQAKANEKKRLLSSLRKDVTKLREENSALGHAYALQLDAYWTLYSGQPELARQRFEDAIHAYRELKMAVFANTLRIRLCEAERNSEDPRYHVALRELSACDILTRSDALGHFAPPIHFG